MVKGIWVGVGIIILIVIGVLIYFYLPNQNINKEISMHENPTMESEMRLAVTEVIDEQKQKGIEISLESIDTYSEHQGYVKLGCESKIDFEIDWDIAEKIINKLVEKYPEKYGEDGKYWFDIEGCSVSGTSPNGVNTYYHPTVWQVSNGQVGPRI